MTRLRLSFGTAILLLLSSFLPRDSEDFRPADITEMVFLQPIGVVSSIAQGNQLRYDAYASLDASEAARQALLRHDEKLHLGPQIVIKDTVLQEVAARLTLGAVSQLERVRKRPLPMAAPWLDTLLAQRRQRYCLFSYVAGFTRTAANYRGQVAKGLGIGLLSMGMIVPEPSKASTRVGVFIYDAQLQAVVYYKSGWPVEKDPLAGVVIDRALTDLLAKDFKLTDRI